VQTCHSKTWVKYSRTEIVERSSNPGFLTTISFRESDGISTNCRIRITAYDVRERVSQTATPIGSANVTFSAVQDTPRSVYLQKLLLICFNTIFINLIKFISYILNIKFLIRLKKNF
jgi:hypothetical protein